jgi:hypothetical protein
MGDNNRIRPLRTEHWSSLFEVPAGPEAKPQCTRPSPIGDATAPSPPQAVATPVPGQLSVHEQILAIDIVNFLDSSFNERLQRSGLSARQAESAAQGLLNNGLAQQVWLGKNRVLAPTGKLHGLLGLESPYGDNSWNVHTFLTLLGSRLYEQQPMVKSVKRSVPLDGPTPAVIDLVANCKDGNRIAIEVIHRSITNVAGHAAKLIGKNYAQLVFLCTDFDQKERVRAIIRNCGFDAGFLSTIRYQIFGALLRQKKQMQLRDKA